MRTVLITEEYWRNSQLSLAGLYGRIVFNGKNFVIVNQEGKDIFECTAEADKAGREMAIEPGEPADLVDEDYIPIYRKVGRDKFLEMLRQDLSLEEMQTATKHLPKS